jgi:hypothetical protein
MPVESARELKGRVAQVGRALNGLSSVVYLHNVDSQQM